MEPFASAQVPGRNFVWFSSRALALAKRHEILPEKLAAGAVHQVGGENPEILILQKLKTPLSPVESSARRM